MRFCGYPVCTDISGHNLGTDGAENVWSLLYKKKLIDSVNHSIFMIDFCRQFFSRIWGGVTPLTGNGQFYHGWFSVNCF